MLPNDDDTLFAEDLDDDPLFADDVDAAEPARADSGGVAWPVLVVDDDAEVHTITNVVLGDVVYQDRTLELVSAYSADEAYDILAARQDICVILLDVVMETDHAGLELVRRIREELGNRLVRIILRTGQPGQAPEREVIVGYDINDYKAKTELSSQKLFTSVIAALRGFQDITTIEAARRGLQTVVDASGALMELRSPEAFAASVLVELHRLIDPPGDAVLALRNLTDGETTARALASRRADGSWLPDEALADLPDPVAAAVAEVLDRRGHHVSDQAAALYLATRHRREIVIHQALARPLGDLDRQLLEVMGNRITLGFENVHLVDQLRASQQATVIALAACAEYKDDDTGAHVLRVADMCTAIAAELRDSGHPDPVLQDTWFHTFIGEASILHDVGKVAIPDAILQKPAKLEPDEWVVMQTHAAKGETMLQRAAAKVEGPTVLSLGGVIAGSHHERWDGTGYPRGLGAGDIPLAGRICAVADVYDALAHKRPYKQPWPEDKARGLIRDNAGSHFDPAVVAAFFRVVDRVKAEQQVPGRT